jgi:hypothetical protein
MKRKHDEGWSLRKISEHVKDEWQLKISHNAIRVILTGKRKIA